MVGVHVVFSFGRLKFNRPSARTLHSRCTFVCFRFVGRFRTQDTVRGVVASRGTQPSVQRWSAFAHVAWSRDGFWTTLPAMRLGTDARKRWRHCSSVVELYSSGPLLKSVGCGWRCSNLCSVLYKLEYVFLTTWLSISQNVVSYYMNLRSFSEIETWFLFFVYLYRATTRSVV